MKQRSRLPDRPVVGRHVTALALVVVGGLALMSCGIPTSGGPTAINKKDVPFQLLSPAGPTVSSTTTPPAVAVPKLIFLVAPTQTVAPVTHGVPVSTTLSGTLTDVIEVLLEGPKGNESAEGLQTFLTGTKTQMWPR